MYTHIQSKTFILENNLKIRAFGIVWQFCFILSVLRQALITALTGLELTPFSSLNHPTIEIVDKSLYSVVALK